ncbi:HTH-type transcriptional repressor NsrR [Methylophilaceae bacterium]|nr:HTH-type transcriptional repressor NsrR [Methylophilaceae bacterium]
MHLTTYSDYSMRVLVYLSLQREKLVTIADIAKAYDISENHLMKVVHHLALDGYIETVRGKGGGMRLACEPEAINLGELVRKTEGEGGLLACTDGISSCCIQPACNLVGILREAHAALFAVLEKYTLADLVKRQQPLTRILMHPRSTGAQLAPELHR